MTSVERAVPIDLPLDVENPASPPNESKYTKNTEDTKNTNIINSIDSFVPPDRPDHISDIDTMKDAVWFDFEDRNRRLSQFWILMIMASVIATSGIGGDSTATVIGAMIVAPLMTPILGTMLSIVLMDGPQFIWSFSHVLLGGGSAVLVGYVLGFTFEESFLDKANNPQIAGRVEPRLIDLLGAMATGVVGAIALVRKDIASSLPGVAIAISLVPPLCVVGLKLNTGDATEASGALLLFATNFACIMIIGVAVMYTYRVNRMVRHKISQHLRGLAIVMIGLLFVVIVFALIISSIRIKRILGIQSCLQDIADQQDNWKVNIVVARASKFDDFSAEVILLGEPPFPAAEELPSDLIAACDVKSVSLTYVPTREYDLEFDS